MSPSQSAPCWTVMQVNGGPVLSSSTCRIKVKKTETHCAFLQHLSTSVLFFTSTWRIIFLISTTVCSLKIKLAKEVFLCEKLCKQKLRMVWSVTDYWEIYHFYDEIYYFGCLFFLESMTRMGYTKAHWRNQQCSFFSTEFYFQLKTAVS